MAKEKPVEITPPRENPLLFGHEAAEETFLQDFAGGRMHHAYLISGSKGIGKATLAYRMARFILSHGALSASVEAPPPSLFGDPLPQDRPAATPSLQMSADEPLFRRVAAGSHTDLLTIQPAFDSKKGTEKSQISAEDARKVPEFLSLTPAEGDWRVVIVDAVDQLNMQAANALLKILEEPPPRAILFLICHEPGGMLATIRSRCRMFKLDSPSRQAFEQALEAVAPHIPSHEYTGLHALSYGSPGLAVTLFEHDGLAMYEGWLNAMRPTTTVAEQISFSDKVAGIKSPVAWATAMHGWQVALHRISTYPQLKHVPIFPREEGALSEIAGAIANSARQRWISAGRNLLNVTDTFNLDKRATVRLMLDPAKLETAFAAA